MAKSTLPERVDEVRAFNRFYTALIGVLNEGILQSPFTLAEARVMFELQLSGAMRATELARNLSMDPAQLSRLTQRLLKVEAIKQVPNPEDGRVRVYDLTELGRNGVHALDLKSSHQIERLLARHGEVSQRTVTQSMRNLRTVFDPTFGKGELSFRQHRIGELGWLIHRQALLYNAEYGWDSEFEALIAQIYKDFELAANQPPKRLWIADINDTVAGSIFVAPSFEDPRVAQLRMLYVEPFARGRGLGKHLVAEAVSFAKSSSYKSMKLWTQDCLTTARKVYEGAGFGLVSEERHHSFGKDLNGQYWELTF